LENRVAYYIGEAPAQYAITFEANGGEGKMEGEIIYEGDYTLPECTFTAPEGMMFKAWQIGEDEYQPGDDVTIEANTTITAVWTAYVPQIIIRMHDSANDGWHGDAIVVKKNDVEIGIATIENAANGIVLYDYDNTADYTFYWQYIEQNNRWPEECSFEILIDGKEVFAALIYDGDDTLTSDCENYEDGELIYSIEGEDVVLESLTIADGDQTEYINDASFTTVGTLTYTRTLPNLMWNALYVPFEIPLSELAENYDVAYINDIRSYDNDENGEIDDMTMEIIRINSGTLNANHPYLIRAKNEEAQNMEIVLSDATLYRTEEISLNCSSMYMEFTITGTYNTLSYEDLEEKYAISTSGAWQKLSEGSSLKPFRLYMEMTPRDGSPVKVEAAALSRIRINMQGEDGNTTGVEILEAPQSINDAVLYDLYGRKVTTPVKGGIYISNGKKVIVK
ncbi:MAG: InlB B-repeat-containing protein, partial [Bacteroidaceae bacterium]|nr:InlB B-repeat-containing protein [Bacteroidaceae bacterium]